jgi:hypothetical protein
LFGRISEVDQARNSLELELNDGSRVKAPLTSQHLETVMTAFAEYRNGGTVALHCVVKKDRQDRLKSIEVIEHMSLLDPLDVAHRLEALSVLQDGWLNGKGKAPSKEGLKWFLSAFETHFASVLPLPHLYPTPEGGIQAEWSFQDWEVSLAVNLDSKHADMQSLRLSNGISQDVTLNLAIADDWQRLNHALLEIEGDA